MKQIYNTIYLTPLQTHPRALYHQTSIKIYVLLLLTGPTQTLKQITFNFYKTYNSTSK
jgi:hypothetical protein